MSVQIEASNISTGYHRHVVLENFSVAIKSGEFWGIVGANGSGKTTLIKTLTGVIPPLYGQIHRSPNLTFGYVPQESNLDTIFPLTTLEVVIMGRVPRAGIGGRISASDADLAAHYMDKVAIAHLANKQFRLLSGGQKQRALIARALTFEPDILVLDEPASGMDISGQAEMLQLIVGLRKTIKQTVLMITHDLNVIANHAQSLIILHSGEQAHFEIGAVKELMTEEKIKQIYRQDVQLISLRDKVHIYVDDTEENVKGG